MKPSTLAPQRAQLQLDGLERFRTEARVAFMGREQQPSAFRQAVHQGGLLRVCGGEPTYD